MAHQQWNRSVREEMPRHAAESVANLTRGGCQATSGRALANERRLEILDWLRDPRAHFREQVDGDLVEDGVCGTLIAEKLGVSAPTLSEHMRVLVQSGLVVQKRIKQWTMYRRDEEQISAFKRVIQDII